MSGTDIPNIDGGTDFLNRWRAECRAKMRAEYMRATAAAEACKSMQDGKPTRYAAALLQIGKDYLAASKCFANDPCEVCDGTGVLDAHERGDGWGGPCDCVRNA